MMSIVFAGLAPHPPLLIPAIGKESRDEVTLTDQAMQKLSGLLFSSKPDALVIISPHGPVFSDAVAILNKSVLQGNFSQFNAAQVRFEEEIDQGMILGIQNLAQERDLMVALMGETECKQYQIDCTLDHGILVPLYYFRKFGLEAPLVPITMGMLSYEDLYKFGTVIRDVSEQQGKRVAVIASGDLSHRLTPQAPAGYNPLGIEFDQSLIKTLKSLQMEKLFDLDQKLIEKAGECGLRPLIMMLGSLDELELKCDVISYEGPFGVGYGVVAFEPTGGLVPSKMESIYRKRVERLYETQNMEHPLVKLARTTIENYCRGKKTKVPAELTPEMQLKAGVFVSIKKHGQLRGCIGTTEPTQNNVAEEIIQNAVSAGYYDPRFFPIEEDELSELTISVDVLHEAEPVKSFAELDASRYGVIVKQGNKTGLLLPDLEGVDTAEEQVEIAKRKAGITNEKELDIFRFEVVRYF